MPRFIAALHDPDDPSATRRVAAGLSSLRGDDARWRSTLRDEGAALLTLDRTDAFRTHVLPHGAGAVFGAVFRREGFPSTVVRAFDPGEVRRIQETEGVSLLTSVWGGYVAIVRGRAPGSWSVLLDPSGAIPVHHVHHAGVHLLFSDLGDALAFDAPPLEVNWPVVASTTLDIIYRGRDTAIEGLTRMSPGDRLMLDVRRAATSIARSWSPSDIVSARRLDDPDRASEELRAAVLDSVRSWSSLFDNILLTLSGGLDSSIVAGSLHETGATSAVTCLNLCLEEQSSLAARLDGLGALRGDLAYLGDERTYARSMARKCGYRLIEKPRSVAAQDLRLLATAPLAAKPSPLVFGLDTNQIFGDVAEEVGAEAMFGGDGGDAVFGATADVLPALDAVAHCGLSRRSLAAMRDAAKLSGKSFWHVLAAVTRRGLTGRSNAKSEPEDAPRAILTDPDAVPSREERLRGPGVPGGVLPPGKDRHAWSMQAQIGTWRDYPLAQRVDPIEPLLAQPVVETCLQIPTYTLSRHGVSRGLARQAFADLLSPEVNARRQKASGTPIQQRLVLSNLAFIKEALLEGALVRCNVLDRVKLEAALASETRLRKDSSRYLLSFLAAEFWLRRFEQERRLIETRRVA